ncbi:Wzz/FepE/Etk N-terminal domain-containing protein [Pseudomonas plecoglossicida]|uniref:Polysaccharide chain length determinant N-terminal domain-containing protein n=1 Tax=Pseudomonas plecoglossicida TaxID=70775 RepID=A0AAD0QW60_PSEDL|nr:hypothetical protein DVB73_09340 [Pseudomonas plecoglossicida]
MVAYGEIDIFKLTRDVWCRSGVVIGVVGLYALIRAAYAFLVTSFYETLPLVVLKQLDALNPRKFTRCCLTLR